MSDTQRLQAALTSACAHTKIPDSDIHSQQTNTVVMKTYSVLRLVILSLIDI